MIQFYLHWGAVENLQGSCFTLSLGTPMNLCLELTGMVQESQNSV